MRYQVLGATGDLEAATHRAVLTLLRGDLATVWLDATAGPAGWSPGPRSGWAADAVRARLAARLAVPAALREPGRPGRGDRTVALDPADDDDFAMALELAPATAAVEAMSRQGRVVVARLRPGDPLLLWLTPQQRAALGRSVPGLTWRLRPARAPRPVGSSPRRNG